MFRSSEFALPFLCVFMMVSQHFIRRRHSHNDQSYMGCESAYVYDPCRFTDVISWPLRYAPLPDFTSVYKIRCVISDGLASIWRQEGFSGLWKGTSLALVGVSNGAVQFMAYEEMKRWGFEQKRKRFAKSGKVMGPEDDKLVSSSPFALPHV